MNALHAAGEADVEQIRGRLGDAPGYDSVRTILRILEGKGHVRHRLDGRRHVFRPTQNRARALQRAWRELVNTFFAGSHEQASATLLRTAELGDLDSREIAGLTADAKHRQQRKKTQP
jgi:BlaI family penicillinase repressor